MAEVKKDEPAADPAAKDAEKKPEDGEKVVDEAQKEADQAAKDGDKATHSTPSTEAKSALDVLGVLRQKNSECEPTDMKCIKRENARAAELAIAKAKEMEGKYLKKKEEFKTDASGLECSMDGFTKMVKELTEVLFMLLAIVKEAALTMIPPEFSKAVKHGWDGMVGVQNWIGYFLAAFYYLGKEYDFADGVCEFYGYGYYAIDELHKAVDWAKSMGFDADKGLEGMIGGLVKQGMGAITGDTKTGVKDIASTDALKTAEKVVDAALVDGNKGEAAAKEEVKK